MGRTGQEDRGDSGGKLAGQVVDCRVYQETHLGMKAQILFDWERTKFSETDVRDECWRKLQTLGRLKAQFDSVMTTGKVASQKISMLQKAKNTVRTVMG